MGEVVRWAARRHDDAGLAAAFDRQVEWIATRGPRTADGTVFHLTDRREVGVDSVSMVVPLLVLAGRVDEAWRQVDGHARRLRDPGSGPYAHIWDEDTGRLARAAHWGTGNGWVAAGLARAVGLVLAEGPDGGDFVARAADHARAVIDACPVHRRPDGLFHDVLDDPETFTEANVAQMLAYAASTGVADGLAAGAVRRRRALAARDRPGAGSAGPRRGRLRVAGLRPPGSLRRGASCSRRRPPGGCRPAERMRPVDGPFSDRPSAWAAYATLAGSLRGGPPRPPARRLHDAGGGR